LIFGIIIVLIVVGVIVAVNFRPQSKTTFTTPAVKNPPEIFDSGTAISSEQDAKSLIILNFNKIMEGTLNLFNQPYPPMDSETYSLSKKIIDSVGNNWQFNNAKVKKGYCAGVGFCIEYNPEKPGYIITVPSPTSVTGAREEAARNNLNQLVVPGEQAVANLAFDSRLMFIVDDGGKVYFAGAYLNSAF